MDLGPEDVLVVRLWRWDAERLKSDAIRHYRAMQSAGLAPIHAVSIFGQQVNAGFDLDESKRRLARAVNRTAKHATFTTVRRIEGAGFEVRYSPPPEDHFDVMLSDPLDDEELAALQSVFDETEKEKFTEWLE